jgi:hypothetical protein
LSPKTKDIPRYPYNEVWHTAKLIPAGPADVSLYRGYPYIEYPCSEVSLYDVHADGHDAIAASPLAVGSSLNDPPWRCLGRSEDGSHAIWGPNTGKRGSFYQRVVMSIPLRAQTHVDMGGRQCLVQPRKVVRVPDDRGRD